MRVLVVAGEASGDAHAARVVERLRAGGARVQAVGGPRLAAAGAEILCDLDRLAVLGFVEVLGRLPHIVALRRRLARLLRDDPPDLFLPVDYPGFNLRLASLARRAGVPVLYYVGPQVWAWGAGRLAVLRRVAAHVALILPFEKPLYDAAGVPASFVGHPLLDDPDPGSVAVDRDLGLFPGSRRQEIERHLPVLLAAATRLRARRPGLRVLASRAPTVPRERFACLVAAHGLQPERDVAEEPARIAMRRCRALLVASGTATLEAALAGVPFAVLYRTGRLNWMLLRRLVRVPHASLANLVAGSGVVREYLQDAATPAALAAEAERLLDDEAERRRLTAGLGTVRARLGTPGAAARVAALARSIAGSTGGAPP